MCAKQSLLCVTEHRHKGRQFGSGTSSQTTTCRRRRRKCECSARLCLYCRVKSKWLAVVPLEMEETSLYQKGRSAAGEKGRYPGLG